MSKSFMLQKALKMSRVVAPVAVLPANSNATVFNGNVKCIRQFAPNAASKPQFRSNLPVIVRYTAGIAFKPNAVNLL